jgi:SAM-dependent methyltransferase
VSVVDRDGPKVRGLPSKLSSELYPILACPRCKDKTPLNFLGADFGCPICGARYPVVGEVPILINPAASLFDPKDYMAGPDEVRVDSSGSAKDTLMKAIRKITPNLTENRNGGANIAFLLSQLAGIRRPRILVVGGGQAGVGMKEALGDSRYEFIETDVYWGDRVNVMADGHDLPFLSESFDAVVCQAVLEHVVSPWRCVEEMHRVLRRDGVIFVDVPFLWPVHLGAYDYTRFSLTGLRLLCRGFEELRADVSSGPGQTLALAASQFFRSFSNSRIWSAFMAAVIPWFLFWLRYCDTFLNNKPQASDGASGLFFIGRKRSTPVPDREIVRRHWDYGKLAP